MPARVLYRVWLCRRYPRAGQCLQAAENGPLPKQDNRREELVHAKEQRGMSGERKETPLQVLNKTG